MCFTAVLFVLLFYSPIKSEHKASVFSVCILCFAQQFNWILQEVKEFKEKLNSLSALLEYKISKQILTILTMLLQGQRKINNP